MSQREANVGLSCGNLELANNLTRHRFKVSGLLPATQHQDLADKADLIDHGVIGLQDAEGFFSFYRNHLDRFLYNILSGHVSLASVREASPLLTAAICVVGALHTRSIQYQPCYQYYLQLASDTMFSESSTLDDVCALCIGASWLAGVSSTLMGTGMCPHCYSVINPNTDLRLLLAIRVASERKLQQCIQQARDPERKRSFRTRLYYLVYVCDHHFSFLWRRPPLTWSVSSVFCADVLLESENLIRADAVFTSQVEICSIGAQILERCLLQPETQPSLQWLRLIAQHNTSLDTWRLKWDNRLLVSNGDETYPYRVVKLQYYFMKLRLCSSVFRPVLDTSEKSSLPERYMNEFGAIAFNSATAILETILTDNELQSYLLVLPTVFHDMIAFTFVFLWKATNKNGARIYIDKSELTDKLIKLIELMDNITAPIHPGHALTAIMSSMRGLVDRLHLVRDVWKGESEFSTSDVFFR